MHSKVKKKKTFFQKHILCTNHVPILEQTGQHISYFSIYVLKKKKNGFNFQKSCPKFWPRHFFVMISRKSKLAKMSTLKFNDPLQLSEDVCARARARVCKLSLVYVCCFVSFFLVLFHIILVGGEMNMCSLATTMRIVVIYWIVFEHIQTQRYTKQFCMCVCACVFFLCRLHQ